MSYVRDITTPITQALLAENMNMALIFPISARRKPEYELYFFRIVRRYPLVREYNSELPTLDPYGGTTYYTEFKYVGEDGLGSGTDIFEILEEYPFHIYHFSIGIRPSDVRIYKRIPAGYTQTAWTSKVPTSIGDKRDFVDGYLSPYDNPTVAGETVIYRKLSFQISIFNASVEEVRPSLRFLGAGYDVLPITDDAVIKKMLAGIIPCRFLTVGGLAEFPYSIPDEWKKLGVRVDRDVINRILAGGR